jgi:predicted transglutaminase-like cysteine proteinase
MRGPRSLKPVLYSRSGAATPHSPFCRYLSASVTVLNCLAGKSCRFFIVSLCLIVLVPSLLAQNYTFNLDPAVLDAAEEKYGVAARARLLAWQALIQGVKLEADIAKLEKVNDFFNQFDFVSDVLHWQKKDYWATPIEFLASNGGDCEDFALAKYFTLKKLGIEEAKLNMTYVKAWRLNQAHMVVTYYEKPASEPLVLDNLTKKIEPASKRTDLLPVFSFNGSSLWISKERGRGNLVGKSDRLALWNDLQKRMPDSLK